MPDVRINLRPLKKMRKIPRRVFNLWADRYRKFAADRFSRFSRGGGNWKKLSPATIAQRRKSKSGRALRRRSKKTAVLTSGMKTRKGFLSFAATILFDTGMLFNALLGRGRRGALQQKLPKGVRVGYGGTAKHGSGAKTIASIAEAHQRGRGRRLPQRKIIVSPPQKLTLKMAGDVERYWKKVAG